MIKTQQDAQRITEEAWLARETGDPLRAITLLEENVEYHTSQEDWFGVVNARVDQIIAWKNYAKQVNDPTYFETALSVIKIVEHLVEEKGLPLRSDWEFLVASVELDAGRYKEAAEKLEHYLSTADLPQARRGEILTHLGFATVMLGSKDSGIAQIKEGIGLIDKSTDEFINAGKNVHAIWKSGALMRWAHVLDDPEEKRNLLDQALKIAEENGLEAREREAKKALNEIGP